MMCMTALQDSLVLVGPWSFEDLPVRGGSLSSGVQDQRSLMRVGRSAALGAWVRSSQRTLGAKNVRASRTTHLFVVNQDRCLLSCMLGCPKLEPHQLRGVGACYRRMKF